MKKRLVYAYWSADGSKMMLPQEHARARLNWMCEIRGEDAEGGTIECELQPDKKMYLNELLPLIRQQIDEMGCDELNEGESSALAIVNCGFNIYRLS